eukprot:555206_1
MLVLIFILFCVVNGDPKDFDCPMRELGMQFASSVNQYITKDQLQDIADALNGAQESQNCNVSVPMHHKPLEHISYSDYNHIPSIYVDTKYGNDKHSINIGSISNPFKTIQSAIHFASYKYGSFIMKKILIREGKYHLPETLQIGIKDSNLIITNYKDEIVNITGSIPLEHITWQEYKKINSNTTIYKTNIVNKSVNYMTGLRINGYRGILSRYPNANPEVSFGSNIKPIQWISSNNTRVNSTYVNSTYVRNDTNPPQNTKYHLSIGGEWLNHFTPPASFWSGGVPIGMTYNSQLLPHTPYKDLSQVIVAGWRQAHWESWFWDINTTITDPKSNKFMFGRGGNQGGRSGTGQEFYVMNVMEELDMPNEFFYNNSERILYYIPNATNFTSFKYEATNLKTLMEIKGNQSNPVKNIIVTGLNFIDSAFTGLDPHGAPSGGDWGWQYSGAIEIIGAENISVTNNYFSRLDGNAIFIFDYNRNISITHNEFIWIGDTVIGSWGSTSGVDFPDLDAKNIRYSKMGIDGTLGNQPRYLNISYNIAHEIGIFEKQSSMYFQAKSCLNYISHNIFYNGPRAGIMFNDGFGGNNLIEKNFVFNTCRESSDHGPFNSWDRQPYLTKVGLNAPNAGITKQYDQIRNNFLISNYGATYDIDHDDTSQYFKDYNNFLVYGQRPYKSNFGGHNIHHWNNIFAYSASCGEIYDNEPLPGTPDIWENCTCVLNQVIKNSSNVFDYMVITKCDTFYPKYNGGFISGNNTINVDGGNMNNIGLCSASQAKYTSTTGDGKNTVIAGWPSTNDLINQAKNILWADTV